MPISLRICLSLFVLSILTAAPCHAEDSLYDKTGARKLSPSEVSLFGPRAGNYRYDDRMIRAAQIAQARAQNHSTSLCWRYVKQALLAAGAVDSYPKTAYAREAATELPGSYGFKKLNTLDPQKAPIGAVLVYGGADAGHVEIRTAEGYASDFLSDKPYTHKRPLIGIFVKPKGVTAALRLRVVPNAKRDEVVGAYGEAIKVKIQAPAMDGKANEALLEFLAAKLGVARRALTLAAGEKSRDKTVAIDGLDEAEARTRLLPA